MISQKLLLLLPRITFIALAITTAFLASVFFSGEADSDQPMSLVAKLELAKQRCEPAAAESPRIAGDEYSWDYQMKDLPALYKSIYDSGKRLPYPMYYSKEKRSFMLPLTADSAIQVPDRFVLAIMQHVQQVIDQKYAVEIFLPDLGHGHFHIPDPAFEAHIKPLYANHSGDFLHRVFHEILTNPGVQIMYHSAEMFMYFGSPEGLAKLPSDERFRNNNRNILGEFSGEFPVRIARQGPQPLAYVEGYTRVAQDIDLSASRNGCLLFQVAGETQYFDISQFSPDDSRLIPSDPSEVILGR